MHSPKPWTPDDDPDTIYLLMNTPRIKICGITRLEDARFSAALGADYLGFIQHRDSPRFVAPEAAAEIIGWVHGSEPVGVFVDASAEEIDAASSLAGFRLVQLHGSEPPELCAEIDLPVIKAVRVMHDASSEQLRYVFERYAESVDYFLLDTHHTSMFGGTGESFNWRIPRELAADYPVFLAGGITAANVEEAVETMRPFAVDLSSGVEESPGIKDFDRLNTFFDVVRQLGENEENAR
jgi:phosphoribosylanthranilate isomerase